MRRGNEKDNGRSRHCKAAYYPFAGITRLTILTVVEKEAQDVDVGCVQKRRKERKKKKVEKFRGLILCGTSLSVGCIQCSAAVGDELSIGTDHSQPFSSTE